MLILNFKLRLFAATVLFNLSCSPLAIRRLLLRRALSERRPVVEVAVVRPRAASATAVSVSRCLHDDR
jgi:hypothetical protein